MFISRHRTHYRATWIQSTPACPALSSLYPLIYAVFNVASSLPVVWRKFSMRSFFLWNFTQGKKGFLTDVSGEAICPIFRGEEVLLGLIHP